MQSNIDNFDIHNIDFLPIAISVSQVINGKIIYISVSKGYCNLFNLDYEKALDQLNNNPYEFISEEDKFWLYESEYQLINDKLLFNDYI